MNDITFNSISIDSHYITEMYIRPFQEFHFYQEDGESSNNGNNDGGLRQSKVNISSHENIVANTEKKTGQQMDIGKKISLLIKQFFTWLSNAKQKFIEVFSKNFSAQIDYVKKNKESGFNNKIKEALANGSFQPNVENIPMFKIPLSELTEHAKHIPERLKHYHEAGWEHTNVPDINVIRAAIYPDKVIAYKETQQTESFLYKRDNIDYWTMEQGDEKNSNDASNANDQESELRKKKLTEYFLFGEVTPEGLGSDSHYTNKLDDKVWDDLCGNILNTEEAIKIGITGICDALKAEAGALDKRMDDLRHKLEEDQNNQSTENNNTKNNPKNEKDQELLKRCEQMSQDLIKVSNEYAVGLADTMQDTFFKTCYDLYKDIVIEYKNVEGTFNSQQPNQTDQQKAQQQNTSPPTNANESATNNQTNGGAEVTGNGG